MDSAITTLPFTIQENGDHLIQESLQEQLYSLMLKEQVAEESTCRKIARIALAVIGVLLSYGTLLPSVLTANAFNPFPGASQISAAAVVVNFGTFGADNYIELSNILFRKVKQTKKSCFSPAKVLSIFCSCVLGFASRFPGAGITLKIAPGLPPDARVPLAILNVFGTCSPEIVSTYNSLDDLKGVIKWLQKDPREEKITLRKKNIGRCLNGIKQRFLQLSTYERKAMSGALANVLLDRENDDGDQNTRVKELLDILLTQENHSKALSIEEIHRSRTWMQVGIGTATTLGTCCALAQNVLFTKFAIDYFVPENSLWKWFVASACALTIAHTSIKTSFVAAYQWADSSCALWSNKQNKKFSETFYPKCDALLTCFSFFWAFALYGILYESAKASVDMNSWEGVAFFAGNFFASFFLIYFVMQSIGEKSIFAWAQSRFANQEANEGAKLLKKVEEIEELVEATSSKSLETWLLELNQQNNLSPEQSRILDYNLSSNEVSLRPIPDETSALQLII